MKSPGFECELCKPSKLGFCFPSFIDELTNSGRRQRERERDGEAAKAGHEGVTKDRTTLHHQLRKTRWGIIFY
jgi:hypothetical protein